MKTYATFGVWRSFRQVFHAFQSRKDADENMHLLYQLVKEDEKRIEAKLGKPVCDLRILEVGVGQGMERSRYFGIRNSVIGMDLDVIPTGFDLAGYAQMVRKNGLGRFLKSMGRKMIIAGPNRRGWEKATGKRNLKNPEMIYGDICEMLPGAGTFDVVMSWSVFEHLPDPAKAIANMILALRPGGVLYISLHLFTANNGHHDIRAFTGGDNLLPPWGHLRSSTQDMIEPSSYLNKWRLGQWRELAHEMLPGCDEVLETRNQKYAILMNDELRKELAEYSDEELYTIDVIYVWRKSDGEFGE
jgi:SAM-dependent methyltransferase